MNLQDAIALASELAYNEDTTHVVGMDDSGGWVVRHIEDPEEGMLATRFRVGGDGIDIPFAVEVFSQLEDVGAELSDEMKDLKSELA